MYRLFQRRISLWLPNMPTSSKGPIFVLGNNVGQRRCIACFSAAFLCSCQMPTSSKGQEQVRSDAHTQTIILHRDIMASVQKFLYVQAFVARRLQNRPSRAAKIKLRIGPPSSPVSLSVKVISILATLRVTDCPPLSLVREGPDGGGFFVAVSPGSAAGNALGGST
jgi:hypothetical protein